MNAQFLLQISGSGLIAPSGMFFNARYSKLHMGNFVDERFKDVFKSDRYWKIMDYLASPNFDAQTMMGTLPIQHYVSKALDDHIKDISKIVPANGDKLFMLIFFDTILSKLFYLILPIALFQILFIPGFLIIF